MMNADTARQRLAERLAMDHPKFFEFIDTQLAMTIADGKSSFVFKLGPDDPVTVGELAHVYQDLLGFRLTGQPHSAEPKTYVLRFEIPRRSYQ